MYWRYVRRRVDLCSAPAFVIVDLTLPQLQGPVGAASTRELVAAFGESHAINAIKLRRVLPSGSTYIKLRTDTHRKTLQVPLNHESECEGGRLFVREPADVADGGALPTRWLHHHPRRLICALVKGAHAIACFFSPIHCGSPN
jgi:hypothetical protein